jgi:peroxin-2
MFHMTNSPCQSTLRSRFNDELVLFISLALYKLSVWDSGASYGAKLQGLRYQRHSPKLGALTSVSYSRRAEL